ncbi:Hypothetical protein PHPALM_6101 [Phytophthora palmivora]|uniref:Uncharacterized protein n=1 Tax=Phytophthora palmivora TaxID=4796 RepID=A0A2P4YFQ9_9STRA|nr:Hypothetical protein PHPALM_6101 [Phytophthora palmivora]
MMDSMPKATEAVKEALAKDQRRRAKYYNRRVRQEAAFGVGDFVWVLRPPRGRGITKLAHQWLGPARIVGDAGFDNWKVRREDTGEHMVVHCSFLVSSSCPSDSLGSVAERMLRELEEEDNEASAEAEDGRDETDTGHDGETSVQAAVEMLRGRGWTRRPKPMLELLQVETAGHIVECGRRRARNRAGRYVLEHEVEYGVHSGQPTGRM